MLELPSEIEVQAQALAAGYRAHFAEMDSQLVYTASEMVVERELASGMWLVGAIDAQGERDGKRFFREDKTANPRSKATWKRHWVMSPQALTYALLSGGRLFQVRKAFKSVVPEFDHEWFTVTDGEVEWWEQQVIDTAIQIKAIRMFLVRGHWDVNIEHGCFQFGEKYPCPFYAQGCSKLDFTTPPKVSRPTGWHLDLKQAPVGDPNVVILDATRIKAWMRCREYYRRTYEYGGVSEPESEALLIGKRFHEILKIYTEGLIHGN